MQAAVLVEAACCKRNAMDGNVSMQFVWNVRAELIDALGYGRLQRYDVGVQSASPVEGAAARRPYLPCPEA